MNSEIKVTEEEIFSGEYKLQETGGTSLYVILPKDQLNRHGFKKGDFIKIKAYKEKKE